MIRTSDPPTATGRDLTRRLIRLFNPISRPLAGSRWFKLWGIVHHRGRTSGRAYATPLVTRRTADGFVIPIPFGDRTNWVQNVLAAGSAEIRWGGRDYRVAAPRIVSPVEAEAAFSGFQRFMLRRIGIDRFLSVVVAPEE
jgi:deazaflavin-dependent oxidoreductase (nitroreductase family)